MRRTLFVLTVLLLVLGTVSAGAPATADSPTGSYIVVFEPGVADVAAETAALARAHGGQVGFIYEHALQGFSITTSPRAAAAIARSPRVAYVEVDSEVSIAAEITPQETPTGVERIFADTNTNIDIDATDDFRVDVDVAVIDTGVDFQHPDLNVNTVGSVNCAGGSPFNAKCSSGGDDDHYHGTHVAGTIGALDNGFGVVGVAPGARIWAVKVLNSNGSGYTSWIVAGIDYVAAHAGDIEVANMSLGGSGFSRAEYDAIQGAVNKGVAFAVAAGNSDADARNYSPAAFDNVLTVSALADFDGAPGGGASPTCRSDVDDTLADFSNWGSAVDIAAPGVCILSTYPIEKGGYGTISGTSMASPHAAGALALLASVSNPANATDVSNLYGAVKGAGNFDWTDDSGDGIQEPLLDVSTFAPVLVATGGSSNTSPTVSITSPSDGATFASGASITFGGTASDTEEGNLTASLAWTSNLAAGQIGTGGSFSVVLADGTHTITATATDLDGSTGSDSITVTVGSTSGGFSLSVTAYKVKGVQRADLTWSGGATSVYVYRDGFNVGTNNDADWAYTDNLRKKGGGSAMYQVCETGSTTTCSNTVTVTW